MESILASRHPCEAFRGALDDVLDRLRPERALVMYGTDGRGSPFIRAARGVAPDSVLTTGEISLELLRDVLGTGVPVCITDAMTNPKYANRTSAVLAGLRSVLCTPVHNKAGKPAGLLYADSRIKVAAFNKAHLAWLNDLSAVLSNRLDELGMGLEAPKEDDWAQVRQRGLDAFRTGGYTLAGESLEQARNMAELWGLSDARLARSLNELGELYRAQRKLAEAEVLMREAVRVFDAQGVEGHPDLGASLNNLAGVLYAQGQLDQAEEVFERALTLWEKSSTNYGQLVPVLSNLATLRQAKGDLKGAEQLCRRAVELAERSFGLTHPFANRCRQKHRELRALLRME